jgi:hypothetical protein
MKDPRKDRLTEAEKDLDSGGPPCDESQADGVPCEELDRDCEDCDRAPADRRESWARQD